MKVLPSRILTCITRAALLALLFTLAGCNAHPLAGTYESKMRGKMGPMKLTLRSDGTCYEEYTSIPSWRGRWSEIAPNTVRVEKNYLSRGKMGAPLLGVYVLDLSTEPRTYDFAKETPGT